LLRSQIFWEATSCRTVSSRGFDRAFLKLVEFDELMPSNVLHKHAIPF